MVFIERLSEQTHFFFGTLEPSVLAMDLSQAKQTGSNGEAILSQQEIGHSLQLRLRILHEVFKKLQNFEIKACSCKLVNQFLQESSIVVDLRTRESISIKPPEIVDLQAVV
jgi:hypothetical protein